MGNTFKLGNVVKKTLKMLNPQVKIMRDTLFMALEPAQAHCDAVAIKEFVSNINHELHTSQTKRD